MISRARHSPTNQENVSSRNVVKTTVTNNKLQLVKRGALGDVGNIIVREVNKNETCKNDVRLQLEAKSKNDVKKKPEKTDKEHAKNAKEISSKVNNRILIRQESKINKKTLQVQKKTNDIVKTISVREIDEVPIYDPDENNKDDPLMVTEYIENILSHLREIEKQFPIREKFLDNTKVTPKMRGTLLNWLVEAHMNFSLETETLHLCASIMDRYLQVRKQITRDIFQLVGTAALFLACKYEEVYVPIIDDFVYICDNAFTKKQLLQMEMDIVRKLGFRMGWPTSLCFLRRYSKIGRVKAEQYNLAKYILELALLEYNVAHVRPSIQAAAASCLSVAILNEVLDLSKVWSPTLVHYSTYKYSDFDTVIVHFAHAIVKAETSKFDAVRQKYATAKFGKVSLNAKLCGPLIRKLTLK